ncbi:MAG: aspartate/glutamate racemase family protein [Pseudomonadota bacterium]
MNRPGLPLEGYTIGVLHLDTRHPLLPGNPQHVQTFNFPVAYEAVPQQDLAALMRGDPALEPLIVAAGERLAARGVRSIVGACGSFAYYQRALASALTIPVFSSVLVQIPFLLNALGERKLGIIAAKASSVNERIFSECGVADSARLAITEMQGQPEFDRMLSGSSAVDEAALREELIGVVGRLIATNPDISAIMLQCSELPPFAADLQYAFDRPVYDAVTLVNWAYLSGQAESFSGLRRRPQ